MLDAANDAAHRTSPLSFGFAAEILPRLPESKSYGKPLDCNFVAFFHDTEKEFLAALFQASHAGHLVADHALPIVPDDLLRQWGTFLRLAKAAAGDGPL